MKIMAVQGEQHGRAILSDALVQAIRNDYQDRPSTRRLAERFRVSRRTIQRVIQGRTWRHVL